MSTFRVWRGDDVRWGETVCDAPGCFRSAALLADYDYDRDRGVPVCLDCAGTLLERAAAIELAGDAFHELTLADPWER